MLIFSYPSVLTYVLGAQKNRLIETVLLSTYNICFGGEIRKLIFWYTLLTKGLTLIKTGFQVYEGQTDYQSQRIRCFIIFFI